MLRNNGKVAQFQQVITEKIIPNLTIGDIPEISVDSDAENREWKAKANGIGYYVTTVYGFIGLGFIALNLLLSYENDESMDDQAWQFQLYFWLIFAAFGAALGLTSYETNKCVFTDTSVCQKRSDETKALLASDNDLQVLASQQLRYGNSRSAKSWHGLAVFLAVVSWLPLVANALLSIALRRLYDQLPWAWYFKVPFLAALSIPGLISAFCSWTNVELNTSAIEENLLPDGRKSAKTPVEKLVEKYRAHLLEGVDEFERDLLSYTRADVSSKVTPGGEGYLFSSGEEDGSSHTQTYLRAIYANRTNTPEISSASSSISTGLTNYMRVPYSYLFIIAALVGTISYVVGVGPLLQQYLFQWLLAGLNLITTSWTSAWGMFFTIIALITAFLTIIPYEGLNWKYMKEILFGDAQSVPLMTLTLWPANALVYALGYHKFAMLALIPLLVTSALEIFSIVKAPATPKGLVDFLDDSTVMGMKKSTRIAIKTGVMGMVSSLPSGNAAIEMGEAFPVVGSEHPLIFAFFLVFGMASSAFVNWGGALLTYSRQVIEHYRQHGTDAEKGLIILFEQNDVFRAFIRSLDREVPLDMMLDKDFFADTNGAAFQGKLNDEEKALLGFLKGNDFDFQDAGERNPIFYADEQYAERVRASTNPQQGCWARLTRCFTGGNAGEGVGLLQAGDETSGCGWWPFGRLSS